MQWRVYSRCSGERMRLKYQVWSISFQARRRRGTSVRESDRLEAANGEETLVDWTCDGDCDEHARENVGSSFRSSDLQNTVFFVVTAAVKQRVSGRPSGAGGVVNRLPGQSKRYPESRWEPRATCGRGGGEGRVSKLLSKTRGFRLFLSCFS
ncbi:hypothetical protein BDZ91DRAFT_518696 [Kalaharituber pfeilii]|nr:hypothetical protein BDZ91DRAFT_518696 [Kalaharituber pfeilii]